MQNNKKPRRVLRTLLIVFLSLAVLAGGTAGVAALIRGRGEAVAVYPLASFTTNADWATSAQTDGVVSTEGIQSVYVSSTQQVTEIYVEEGQTVHEGDPILAYDTTLSQLELERQAISVSQLELDLDAAEAELREIDTYRIGTPQSYSYYVPGSGSGRTYAPAPYMPYERTGSALGTAADPLIYLWDDSCVLSEEFLSGAAALSSANRDAALAELFRQPEEPAVPSDPPEPEPEAGEENPPDLDGSDEPDAPDEPDGPDAPDETPGPVLPDGIYDPHVFIVFETRESNAPAGPIQRTSEISLLFDQEAWSWSMNLIEPAYDPGEDAEWADEDDGGYYEYFIDTNVYYTAAEIAQMKAECNQRITDLNLKLKQARLEYDRLSYELSSGEVLSRIDGVVKTVRDPDEARAGSLPVVLVSAGGGYYVTAVLGELELGTMRPGDTVSVQSWENYGMYEGTITDISPYPDESNRYWYYSEGNQNVSRYPFRVFVNEDAILREGEYVTLTYSAAGTGGGGLFLQTPFIRQENGQSYIYAAGADGKLEQRFVRTGKNLWGSYLEILDGLTEGEYIAFPYGRDVREGANTRVAEPDELYSAMYYG